MSKTKWTKIADQQYYSMPKDFQDDWADLRKLTQ